MKQKEETFDNPLATIMSPRSIAIVGASNAFTKMGTIQFLNLLHSGYRGEVFLIHPKEREIFGRTVYSPPFAEILGNFRGMNPVNKEVLSTLLIRLGHLALHFPRVKEIDLNPIIIEKDGLPKVVDALIITDSTTGDIVTDQQ